MKSFKEFLLLSEAKKSKPDRILKSKNILNIGDVPPKIIKAIDNKELVLLSDHLLAVSYTNKAKTVTFAFDKELDYSAANLVGFGVELNDSHVADSKNLTFKYAKDKTTTYWPGQDDEKLTRKHFKDSSKSSSKGISEIEKVNDYRTILTASTEAVPDVKVKVKAFNKANGSKVIGARYMKRKEGVKIYLDTEDPKMLNLFVNTNIK